MKYYIYIHNTIAYILKVICLNIFYLIIIKEYLFTFFGRTQEPLHADI